MGRKKKVVLPELTGEELEAAKREMNIVSVKVADLRLQNEQFASETKELEGKMEEAKKSYEHFLSLLENTRKEAEAETDKVEQRRQELIEVENRRNEVSTEVGELKAEMEELRKEREDALKELAQAKVEREAIGDELAKREESLSRKEVTLNDIEEELNIRNALLDRREELFVNRSKAGL